MEIIHSPTISAENNLITDTANNFNSGAIEYLLYLFLSHICIAHTTYKRPDAQSRSKKLKIGQCQRIHTHLSGLMVVVPVFFTDSVSLTESISIVLSQIVKDQRTGVIAY
jgi:hypothetical protein